MNKAYILSFSIGVLVMVCSVLLGLVILLPQQSTNINVSLEEYNKIEEASYKFEATKDITIENLVRTYSISDAQMNTYKKNYQYVAGNSDPFSVKNTSGNGSTTDGDKNNSGGTITNSNGNTVVVGK